MQKANIFTNIPQTLNEELFTNIISKDGIKIERIISDGHTTNEGQWYDQESDEWVIVLQGEAVLSFEDEGEVRLKTGNYLNIPAHKKHRVSYTSPDEKTIWLAVYY